MHHHLRVSYIAQHSLHHLEEYLQAPLVLLLLVAAPLWMFLWAAVAMTPTNCRSMSTMAISACISAYISAHLMRRYADGAVYEGEYRADKKDGRGSKRR